MVLKFYIHNTQEIQLAKCDSVNDLSIQPSYPGKLVKPGFALGPMLVCNSREPKLVSHSLPSCLHLPTCDIGVCPHDQLNNLKIRQVRK